AIPNTELKPWPRVILGIGHKLTDSLGIGGGVLYQLNYGYGGAKTTHLVGAGLGPSLKLGKRVSVGLQMGPAKTLGKKGLWSFLIQPGLSYTFP
ncbi:hypothetical protein KKC87_00950, partial [Patescibacteria group bacterium]|nr:hypothetical protein [Patescibacteria group bacterium]